MSPPSIVGKQRGRGVGERCVWSEPINGTVDRLGGLIIVKVVQPAFGCTSEELAARYPEPCRSNLDPLKRVVRQRYSCLHSPSITGSYPARKRAQTVYAINRGTTPFRSFRQRTAAELLPEARACLVWT